MSEGRYQISEKQCQFLELLKDPSINELLVGGAAGGSKTVSMCLGIIHLAKEFPGVRIFVGRKTLKSLKQSTINTLLNKVHPMLDCKNICAYRSRNEIIQSYFDAQHINFI